MNTQSDLQDVANKIYRFRGQAVMLGPDLALLYGVQTKALTQAVRRNLGRFPMDFMFQLTWIETQTIKPRSQIVTLESGSNLKYRPYAFTEHGVAMLSCVLRNPTAVGVSVAIIRAFVKLRHALTTQREIARRLEKVEGKLDFHDTDIRLLHRRIEDIHKNPPIAPEKSPRIHGFEGPT